MLLRGKSRLINSNILHLTFTLVGTVDSEHENSCIPNPIAFRDLLAGILQLRSLCVDFSSIMHSLQKLSICSMYGVHTACVSMVFR